VLAVKGRRDEGRGNVGRSRRERESGSHGKSNRIEREEGTERE
jgi:hypothetical protein